MLRFHYNTSGRARPMPCQGARCLADIIAASRQAELFAIRLMTPYQKRIIMLRRLVPDFGLTGMMKRKSAVLAARPTTPRYEALKRARDIIAHKLHSGLMASFDKRDFLCSRPKRGRRKMLSRRHIGTETRLLRPGRAGTGILCHIAAAKRLMIYFSKLGAERSGFSAHDDVFARPMYVLLQPHHATPAMYEHGRQYGRYGACAD